MHDLQRVLLFYDEWITSNVLLCSSLKAIWLIYGDCVAINIAHAALSFFKPFPRKCSTHSNGSSNAVAVMSWTAAFLQDKLRHITLPSLWTNFLLTATQSTHTESHRGHHRQLLIATWKTLINISPLLPRLLSKCHLPNTVPQNPFFQGPHNARWHW